MSVIYTSFKLLILYVIVSLTYVTSLNIPIKQNKVQKHPGISMRVHIVGLGSSSGANKYGANYSRGRRFRVRKNKDTENCEDCTKRFCPICEGFVTNETAQRPGAPPYMSQYFACTADRCRGKGGPSYESKCGITCVKQGCKKVDQSLVFVLNFLGCEQLDGENRRDEPVASISSEQNEGLIRSDENSGNRNDEASGGVTNSENNVGKGFHTYMTDISVGSLDGNLKTTSRGSRKAGNYLSGRGKRSPLQANSSGSSSSGNSGSSSGGNSQGSNVSKRKKSG